MSFWKKIKEALYLDYESYILVFDFEGLISKNAFKESIKALGFEVVDYRDVEVFRYYYETQIKTGELKRVLVTVEKDCYIPYDIRTFFKTISLNYELLFPKLNQYILEKEEQLNFDLLTLAYEELYENKSTEADTIEFISKSIFEKDNLERYQKILIKKVEDLIDQTINYQIWYQIAVYKAELNLLDLNNTEQIESINDKVSMYFNKFIMKEYGQLANRSYFNGPILISHVMDYLLMKNSKTALIVMDGMSISDWKKLSQNIDFKVDIKYLFAMVPSITSISRQSLLSGKLPIEHDKPFSLSKERKQFITKAEEVFTRSEEVNYYRGYEFEISYKEKFICTIINEIDNLVHAQIHGMIGHIDNIVRMATSGRLNQLIERLKNQGFDVYITSDHGNKETMGIGKPRGTGVEVETKSQRMMVLKDYADIDSLSSEYHLQEYPGYYLPKDYNYMLCEDSEALAYKGEKVMSHGGISIEEVIVPFIRIKGDEENE